MEVRAVRHAPAPPPVQKVVVELSESEARSYLSSVSQAGHTGSSWFFARIAHSIECALSPWDAPTS